MKNEHYVSKTKEWVEKCIIGLNLCPYAVSDFKSHNIRYHLMDKFSQETLITKVTEIASGASHKGTDLLICPFLDELSFSDFYTLTTDISLGLESLDYQAVAFHPDFHFQGESKDAKASYIGKSPFACIHILSERQVAKLNISNNEARKLSSTNKTRLENLDHQILKKLFLQNI